MASPEQKQVPCRSLCRHGQQAPAESCTPTIHSWWSWTKEQCRESTFGCACCLIVCASLTISSCEHSRHQQPPWWECVPCILFSWREQAASGCVSKSHQAAVDALQIQQLHCHLLPRLLDSCTPHLSAQVNGHASTLASQACSAHWQEGQQRQRGTTHSGTDAPATLFH